MNELLVVKDVLLNSKIGGGLISGINEINQLAAGALAIFDDKNNMLTAANVVATLAAVPNKKSIYFAVGSGDATLGAKISQPVRRMPVKNVETKVYTAPVLRAISIGLDGTGSMNIATPVAGTFAYLRIVDTAQDNINLIRAERYSYEVKIGDTAALIVAGLIAACNANLSSKYTVTVIGSNTGILVTAKNFGDNFEIGLDGIISGATVQDDGSNSSTLIEYGSGTSTELLAIESEFNSEDGHTSRLYLDAQYWKKPSDVVVGATYDMWNIQWAEYHTSPVNTSPASNKQIIIAIPTSPATFVAATFASILAQAFGVNSINSETGA